MNYRIIEGTDQISLDDVVRLLKTTYWADKRSREQILKSMENSSCYGIVLEGREHLAGFARVISDYATSWYLCDVVIDPECRHRGLGKALVSHIASLPEFAGIRGFLFLLQRILSDPDERIRKRKSFLLFILQRDRCMKEGCHPLLILTVHKRIQQSCRIDLQQLFRQLRPDIRRFLSFHRTTCEPVCLQQLWCLSLLSRRRIRLHTVLRCCPVHPSQAVPWS